jgi:integrase
LPTVIALSDIAIRRAKPSSKPVKLTDGGGLYLLVNPNGSKWWRIDYRFRGKRQTLSLGTFPDTGLADARAKRDEERKRLAAGIDPSAYRKAAKAAGVDRAGTTFELVAREWFEIQRNNWVKGHADKVWLRLANDIFPYIGSRPIAEVTAQELLATINRMVARDVVESAHRVLQDCGRVFRYGIVTGRAENNPAANLRGALPNVKETNRAAIIDVRGIAGLMRAIDSYQGSPITTNALRLNPLVFVRPGELRQAEWAEFDLEAGQWNIPASKMKIREPHIVPLSTQALEILQEVHLLTGRNRYVFPCARGTGRPMSNNTILGALRRMGYTKDEMTGHGFRAMARTTLDEILGYRPELIEHQLAHAVREPNGRAYNRTSYLVERRVMMQAWADYLDALKEERDLSFLTTHKRSRGLMGNEHGQARR